MLLLLLLLLRWQLRYVLWQALRSNNIHHLLLCSWCLQVHNRLRHLLLVPTRSIPSRYLLLCCIHNL
jgi:hypothetical protein